MQRHLVVKIGLTLVVTIALGFVVFGAVSLEAARRTMAEQNQRAAGGIAKALAAGFRSAMLQGDGSAVRSMLEDAGRGVARAEVNVYGPEGELVFHPPPPPPAHASLPGPVRAAIEGRSGRAPNGSRVQSIPNAERCRPCHEEGEVRGALVLGTRGARAPLDDGEHGMEVISALVKSGFVQIMTADHEEQLDAYFAELRADAPELTSITVFGRDRVAAYGDEFDPPTEVLRRALAADARPFLHQDAGTRWRVVPLPNEGRCRGCHGNHAGMRGALFVGFAPGTLGGERTLTAVTETSLDHIMLSGLGRLIVRFLDDEAATGAVSELRLHDRLGRVYHDPFVDPEPPAHVARALSTIRVHADDEADRFVYVEPFRNEPRCQRCHGTDRDVRGAIEVRLDTTAEQEARRTTLLATTSGFGFVIVGGVLFVLWLILRRTVLRPVSHLGEVAERVGTGDLGVQARLSSVDEIGRLGSRLNDMVTGLRQKLALSKFVSAATLESVHRASKAEIARHGTRRRLTVLFSDIRGFTSYSEKHSPEEVVTMLNAYLDAQAQAVLAHGGDIDKFVGDELMARFDGEGQERRAILAALDMLDAVHELNAKAAAAGAGTAGVDVGVGINAGDMVLGAMGAQQRMDYTVIGDAVNLGARLCSAAKGSQVLVSAATAEAAGAIEATVVEPLDPIPVKGKQDPIPIVSIRRAPNGET